MSDCPLSTRTNMEAWESAWELAWELAWNREKPYGKVDHSRIVILAMMRTRAIT
jgi:hypothetical protein